MQDILSFPMQEQLQYNLYKVYSYMIIDNKYTLNIIIPYNCIVYNMYNWCQMLKH